MKTIEGVKLTEILPEQDHYWLLWDGERYAKHGQVDYNGIAVFLLQELAEKFLLTIGRGSNFKPVSRSLTEVWQLLLSDGICIPDGLNVKVYKRK